MPSFLDTLLQAFEEFEALVTPTTLTLLLVLTPSTPCNGEVLGTSTSINTYAYVPPFVVVDSFRFIQQHWVLACL